MLRTINYIISKPDGTPWPGVRLRFLLSPGSFTATEQFPAAEIKAPPTDADGVGSVELWANEGGESSSAYVVVEPSRDTYKIVVPETVEAPAPDLELSELRELYAVPSSEAYRFAVEYIDAQITDHVQAATKGGTGLTEYVAGDLLYASGVAAIGRREAVAAGLVLLSAGVGAAPVYGKITDAHVDAAAAIDATKLGGTLPDARLSANVPLIDAVTNAFTGAASFGTTLHAEERMTIGSGGTSFSTDSAVHIQRTLTGSGAAHGFSDETAYTRDGSYNSFDAYIRIEGTETYNHYAAFQARSVLNTTGTISEYRGYSSNPTIKVTAVGEVKHFLVSGATYSEGGTAATEYGLYVDVFGAGAGTKWAVYTAGTQASHFGGAVEIVGTLDVTGATTVAAAINSVRGATTSDVIRSRLDTDTTYRFTILVDGEMRWGEGGVAAPDLKLYRANNGALRTDGSLVVDGNMTLTGQLNAGADLTVAANTATFTGSVVLSDTLSVAETLEVFGETTAHAAHTTIRTAIADDVVRSRLDTDTAYRFILETDGGMYWGPGGVAAQDLSLFRASNGSLRTTGAFYVEGATTSAGTSAHTGASTFASTVAIGTTAIAAGADLEINKVTGSATITPVVLRLRSMDVSTAWDIVNPWAKISFYSADGSGAGVGERAYIGARMENAAGGPVALDFFGSFNSLINLATLSPTTADGETALLLRRDVGSVETVVRVSMGAADSGAAGFKLLRVPN